MSTRQLTRSHPQRFDNVSLDPPASVSELPSAHSRPAAAAAPPPHRGGAIGEGAKRDSKGMSHEATASPPAGRTPPLPFPPPPPPVGPSPAGQLAAASGARLEDARLEDARLEDAYVPVRGYMRAMIKVSQELLLLLLLPLPLLRGGVRVCTSTYPHT